MGLGMVAVGVMVILVASSEAKGAEYVVVKPGDTINGIVLNYCKPKILAANPGITPRLLGVKKDLIIPLVPQERFDTLKQQLEKQEKEIARVTRELTRLKKEAGRAIHKFKEAAAKLANARQSRRNRAYALTFLSLLALAVLLLFGLKAYENRCRARAMKNLKEQLRVMSENYAKLLDERRDINTLCQRLMVKAHRGEVADLASAWAKLVKDIEAKYGAQKPSSQDDKVIPIRPKVEGA